MTPSFASITQLISEPDLQALMEAARGAAAMRELWLQVRERLSAPAETSRRNALKVFREWYLNGDSPRSEPAVLAWHAFPEAQVRREILHLERCRHLLILDDFVSNLMYPRLGQGQLSLLGDQVIALTSPEIDGYVQERLPSLSKESRRVTRNKIRLLLVQAGLVQRTGSDFAGTWHYTYYRPTWQAWLYGLYRELEDNGHRQRAERYLLEEARLPRRFLVRSADGPALLSECARRSALEFETFAGERYVRLLYPDTAALVRALATGP